MVSIEKKIVAPVNTPLDEVDRLSKQRVKGMRDSDGCSYFSGAACGSSIDRKRKRRSTGSKGRAACGINVITHHKTLNREGSIWKEELFLN
jgi:hypothetical protein